MNALVLSGGGARGAYQAGVLLGLLEQGLFPRGPLPFPILVGTSAGALNAATLAAHADSFERGVSELVSVWGTMRAERVFRTDLPAILSNGLGWLRDLTLGGLLGRVGSRSLLDTRPLAALLERIPLDRIPGHVEAGLLRAVSVGAVSYATGNGVLFLQGQRDLPLWERPRQRVERTALGVPHLLASSAIPLFFPAVTIDGRPFGDGCVRNNTPLSPAIQLGASKILSIGVRQPFPLAESSPAPEPSAAQIVGVLLDAVMLDALESDTEHCQRVNRALLTTGDEAGELRPVEVLCFTPSQSLSAMALELRHQIPLLVRYLLGGLGDRDSSAELISYLLFDASFTGALLALGCSDVRQRREELRAFLSPSGDAASSDQLVLPGDGKLPIPRQ